MATVLLDTHAYVWALTSPDRLGDTARDIISNPSSDLLVSAATVWEMAIKHRAGRWPEAESLLADHEALIAGLDAKHLEITWRDARRAGSLRWEHADPFDRMLVAQALSRDVALVSRDHAFESVAGLRLIW